MKKISNKKEQTPKIPTNWTPIPVALVLAAIGVCFIVFSSIIEYLAFAIGIFVIIGATVLATVTLVGKRSGALFVLKLVFAVCILASGVITIVFKNHSAGIVCMVFSGAVAVDGSIKLGMALQSKKYSVPGKTVATTISVLTIVAALAMVRFTPAEITDDNINTCSLIIGITFILDAVGNFITPFLSKGVNKRIVNNIENDYEAQGLKLPEELEADAKESEKVSEVEAEAPVPLTEEHTEEDLKESDSVEFTESECDGGDESAESTCDTSTLECSDAITENSENVQGDDEPVPYYSDDENGTDEKKEKDAEQTKNC